MIFDDFVFKFLRFEQGIYEDLGSCLKVCHVFLLGFVKNKKFKFQVG